MISRARSRRFWWDASARIAVCRPGRVSLESLMITKRCQGRHLGLPRGSHQGVLREPVRAESGGTPRLELPFGGPDVSLLRASWSPNAALGVILDSQGEPPGMLTRARSRRKWWDASARRAVWRRRRVSLESLMLTKRCQGHHLGAPRGSHPGCSHEPVRADFGGAPQLELPLGPPTCLS